MFRVKICGITDLDELRIVETCGADAIGFLVGQVHTAYDFISPQKAKMLTNYASPFINTVLVTHVEDPIRIIELSSIVPTTSIQLHGDLSLSSIKFIKSKIFTKKIIGRISVTNHSAIKKAARLEKYVDAIILDSVDLKNDKVGGTGLVHDWYISKEIVTHTKIPIILAGGLTPSNVVQAIDIVNPWAVDVNSGVEDSSGRKNLTLVRDFILNAKKLLK